MSELQAQINLATELEKKLSRAARLDRSFKIPALFETLLPSVQSDCDRAASIADSDPVLATSEHVPLGLRKITDALEVARTIEKARSTLLPQLDTSGKELEKLGFDHRWIAARIEELSNRANQILGDATERAVADEVSQFGADMNGLGLRVRRCCDRRRNSGGRRAPPRVASAAGCRNPNFDRDRAGNRPVEGASRRPV